MEDEIHWLGEDEQKTCPDCNTVMKKMDQDIYRCPRCDYVLS